ncbi:MAG: ribokinase-like domain-containing protein [Promethearchaeota archaeon CR_4]|nr:MAG: ribokinase-like domain-containing protein [Candidatus Lokiarchaeota archaeon CR_4]
MGPNIICLGELLVEIMRAEVGVPHSVPGIYKGPYPSGAPAIFIDSAARMAQGTGLSCGYIGAIGNDDFGHMIVTKLKNDGVDVSQIVTKHGIHTGVGFVQYNQDGTRKFIFATGASGMTSPNDVKPDYFKDVKAFHIMGSALSISELSREACYKALKIAQKANPKVVISFDPNLRPEMLAIDKIIEICQPILDEANILLPSGEEAEMLVRVNNPRDACLTLLKKHASMVVWKRGKDGSTVFSKEGTEINEIAIPGFKVKQVDPTGAGDSFGGAFVVATLLGWPIQKRLRFANAVGALKVTTWGPMSDTSLEEVLKFANITP